MSSLGLFKQPSPWVHLEPRAFAARLSAWYMWRQTNVKRVGKVQSDIPGIRTQIKLAGASIVVCYQTCRQYAEWGW